MTGLVKGLAKGSTNALARASGLAAALLLSGCELDQGSLVLSTVPPGPLPADGKSQTNISVCNTASTPVAELSIALYTSGGRWVLADPEVPVRTTVRVTAQEPCATTPWVTSSAPGPVRFEARVNEVRITSLDTTTVEAPIRAVQIVPSSPFLNAVGETNLNLSLVLEPESDGTASVGTRATIEVLASSPAGGAAVANTAWIQGTSSSTTLTAADGTQWVRLYARVAQPGRPIVTMCRELTVAGGIPPNECP